MSLMNSHNAVIFSVWSVLSFNVRGINSAVKGNGIRCAIRESRCDVVCLQETEKEYFDRADLRIFAPIHLTLLLLSPRWEIRVVPLLFGIARNWWAMLFIRMNMRFRWNFSLIRRMNLGSSQISTRPVLRMAKLNSSIGSPI